MLNKVNHLNHQSEINRDISRNLDMTMIVTTTITETTHTLRVKIRREEEKKTIKRIMISLKNAQASTSAI